MNKKYIFNGPGVAGDVLPTPSGLTDKLYVTLAVACVNPSCPGLPELNKNHVGADLPFH